MLHSENFEQRNIISSVRIELEEGTYEFCELRMEARIVVTEHYTDWRPHRIEQFTRTSSGRSRYTINNEKNYSWFGDSVLKRYSRVS